MATTVPVAIYLLAVGALHSHPGRPRVVSFSIGVAAVAVLVDSFLPAPLYVTAGVLAVLVAVLTVATRTRSVPPGCRIGVTEPVLSQSTCSGRICLLR